MKVHESPFTHAVCDTAVSPELVRAARAAWPAPDWPGWHALYDNPLERKRTCDRWELFPAPCAELLRQLLTLNVMAFGTRLVPDLSLWGGGMQAMLPGGHLDLHLDADRHPKAGLARRLNGVLFLNDGWRPEWGGQLELWDAGRRAPQVLVNPAPGRLAVFEVSDRAYHAVAGPLCCPEGVQRMTLAVWWYGPSVGPGKRPRAAFVAAAAEEQDTEKDALRRCRSSSPA